MQRDYNPHTEDAGEPQAQSKNKNKTTKTSTRTADLQPVQIRPGKQRVKKKAAEFCHRTKQTSQQKLQQCNKEEGKLSPMFYKENQACTGVRIKTIIIYIEFT